jgi:hypothetical protein
VDRTPGTGWLAIAAPPTAIVWIEESSLELEQQETTGALAIRAWVRRPQAVIRSGNAGAKLPGPPRGRLTQGTLVQMVDHPGLTAGQSVQSSRWLAIVPLPDLAFYVRADGVRWALPHSTRPSLAEIRASFEGPATAARHQVQGTSKPTAWPPEISAELDRLDALYQVILASQAIEQWHFETVRAGYQNLVKRAGDRTDLEEALRSRLARVAQHEQAARAARTIETILAKSHRRDQDLALLRRDLARLERARSSAYDAVGFIQPSVRRVDGRRLFALIGGEGKTIAYLDVPPGLDPDPFLARRVGVRGQTHFNEDLGTRLISVRDLESTEAKR